jgi:hypothetical protein
MKHFLQSDICECPLFSADFSLWGGTTVKVSGIRFSGFECQEPYVMVAFGVCFFPEPCPCFMPASPRVEEYLVAPFISRLNRYEKLTLTGD